MTKRSIVLMGLLFVSALVGSSIIGTDSVNATPNEANGSYSVFLPLILNAATPGEITFTPVDWTIYPDWYGPGIHYISMIADVSPMTVGDLQDFSGALIWNETYVILCADPTYPPIHGGIYITIREVGDGYLRIGDIFASNDQGPGCSINTSMQNAFDDYGLPETACFVVWPGVIPYDYCAPLNVIP